MIKKLLQFYVTGKIKGSYNFLAKDVNRLTAYWNYNKIMLQKLIRMSGL